MPSFCRSSLGRRARCLALAVVGVLPVAARGQFLTSWISAESGSWFSATAWSNGVPGAASDVFISATGAPHAITFDGTASIASLTLNSINATLDLQNGSLSVSSLASASAGTVLIAPGASFHSTGTLLVTGNSSWNVAGNLSASGTTHFSTTSSLLISGGTAHFDGYFRGPMSLDGGRAEFNWEAPTYGPLLVQGLNGAFEGTQTWQGTNTLAVRRGQLVGIGSDVVAQNGSYLTGFVRNEGRLHFTSTAGNGFHGGLHIPVGSHFESTGDIVVDDQFIIYINGGFELLPGATARIASGKTLTVSSGTLSTGPFHVENGGELQLYQLSAIESGATFTGSGPIELRGYVPRGGVAQFPIEVNIPWNYSGPTRIERDADYIHSVNFNRSVHSPITIAENQEAQFNAAIFSTISFESSRLHFGPAVLSDGVLKSGIWDARNGSVASLGDEPIREVGPSASVILNGSAKLTNLSSLIRNAGQLELRQGSPGFFSDAGTLTNTGTMKFDSPATAARVDVLSFNNLGTFEVAGGRVDFQDQVLQYQNGVLSGGTWKVTGQGSAISFGQDASITTVFESATVILDGEGTEFPGFDSLHENRGRIQVSGGKSFFTPAGSIEFVQDGSMSVGSASLLTFASTVSLGGRSDIAIAASATAPGRLVLTDDVRTLDASGTAVIRSIGTGNLGIVDFEGEKRTLDVNNGTADVDLRISAQLSNGSLRKLGEGLLQIDAASAYSGSTDILGGTLRASVDGAIPQLSTTRIGAGTLHVTAPQLTVAALQNSDDGNGAAGGVLLTNAILTIGNAGTNEYAGSVSGSGGLTKAGVGIQALSGPLSFVGPLEVANGELRLSTSNTFTGPVSIQGNGTLTISSDTQLGNNTNGVSLVSGGNLKFAGTTSSPAQRSFSVQGLGSVEVTAGNNVQLNGPLNSPGTAHITKLGEGSLTLSGGSLAGTLSVGKAGGTLRVLGGRASFPNVDHYKAEVRGTLVFDRQLPGFNFGPEQTEGSSTPMTLSGGTFALLGAPNVLTSESFTTLTLGTGASTIRLAQGSSGRTLLSTDQLVRGTGATLNVIAEGLGNNPATSANRFTVANGVPVGEIDGWLTIENPATGSIDFSKYTSAGLVPLETSDYSVGTFIRNRHVKLTASRNVPNDGGGNPFAIKTLSLNPGSGSVNVIINANQPLINTLSLTKGGLVKTGAGSATLLGGTLSSGTDAMNIFVSAGTLNIESTIGAGTYSLTKRGDGVLRIGGGTENTYHGVTVISGGLLLDKQNAVSVPGNLVISGGAVTNLRAEQIADTAQVLIDAGAYTVNGFTETIADLVVRDGSFSSVGTLIVTGGATLSGGSTVFRSKAVIGSDGLTIRGGVNSIRPGLQLSILEVGLSGLVFQGRESPEILLDEQPGQIQAVETLKLSGPILVHDPGSGTARIGVDFPGGTPLAQYVRLAPGSGVVDVDRGSALNDFVVEGSVVGTETIIKRGNGAVLFLGPLVHTGGTVIESGVLEVSGLNRASGERALGVGVVQIKGVTSIEQSPTLSLRSDRPLGNELWINAGAAHIGPTIDIDQTGGGSQYYVFGSGTFDGKLDVVGNGTLQIGSGTQTHQLTGDFSLRNHVDTVIEGVISGGTNDLVYFAAPGSEGFARGGPEGLPRRDSYGGAGTLHIRGGGTVSNSWGSTTVNAGTVVLSRPNGVTAIPGTLTINRGQVVLMADEQIANNALVSINGISSALNIGGKTETIGALRLNGGTVLVSHGGMLKFAGTGSFAEGAPVEVIRADGGSPATITGTMGFAAGIEPQINVTAGASVAGLTISGSIIAPNGITKTGNGNLVLSGNNAGLFVGAINVDGGFLTVTRPEALGSGTSTTVQLNSGGALRLAPAGTTSMAITNALTLSSSGRTIDVPTGLSATINSMLNGPGIIKSGGGTLTIQSLSAFSSSTIELSGGVLNVNGGSNSVQPIHLNGGALRYAGMMTDITLPSVFATAGGIDVAEPDRTVSIMSIVGPPNELISPTFHYGFTLDKRGAGHLAFPIGIGTVINATESRSATLNVFGGTVLIGGTPVEPNGRLTNGKAFGVYTPSTGTSTLVLTGSNQNILNNAAIILLSGPGSRFDALDSMTTNSGMLTITNGRNFTTAGSFDNSSSDAVRLGQLRIGKDSVFRVNGSLTNTGTIDISGHGLIVDYTDTSPITLIREQLTRGYNGGSWNGINVASGTVNLGVINRTGAVEEGRSLGYAEISAIGESSILGQTVDNTTVVVLYTLEGDANLDLMVGIGDFALLAANFNMANSGWVGGDFDYDGLTNIDDFALLAGKFNQSAASMPLAESAMERSLPRPARVPEPASAVFLLASALAGMRTRVRRDARAN